VIRHRRRKLLSILFLCAIVSTLIHSSCKKPAKGPTENNPNILFLLTDDQRWDAMGCYGNNDIRTPAMDGLAAQGARLNLFYVAASLCCPSRAVFLSGLYPHQTGITFNEGILDFPPKTKTVADYLNKEGYLTGFIGKVHLSGNPNQWNFKSCPVYLPGFMSPHQNPELTFNGKKQKTNGMITTIFADAAIDFLEEHKNEKWFLWFASTAPHIPLLNDPKYPYDAKQIDPPPGWQGGASFNPNDFISYYSTISMLDSEIGRILKKLDDLGLREKTIVFLISDNGLLLGSHGLKGKSQWFEESVRVPAIVRWPGKIQPGKIVNSPISSADFVPTILNLSNVAVPNQMEGVSMLPALTGQPPLRKMLFSEVHRGQKVGGGFWQLVRNNRWKFVQFLGKKESHLYDMKNDPQEAVDLVDDPNYHDVVVRMRGKMKQWYESTPPLRKQSEQPAEGTEAND
jgi:arylsulfatase A-like enzyme